MNYHTMNPQEIFQLLDSSEKGLTSSKASKRLRDYGPNTLSQPHKDNVIKKFFLQFCDFMTIILMAAAIISIVISYISHETDYIEPVIIMAIVVLNAFIGVIQEAKAEHAITALKKLSALHSKVIRNNKVIDIESQELVLGDVIYVETGDMIPADAYLLESTCLTCDESSLTGESMPCEKSPGVIKDALTPVAERTNMIFSGSIVCQGHAKAIVTATGHSTCVGNIATMIMEDNQPMTPLQKRLEHIGKILGISCVIICVIIFIAGFIRGIGPMEMFMTSVSLAVAAIPEGLPIIVTIMLCLGVTKMSSHGAIVRNIPAVETLGSAQCICTDKTGTLTINSMTVTDIRDGFGSSDISSTSDILTYCLLCCNSTVSHGDPTEQAIIRRAQSFGISQASIGLNYTRLDEIPFDSQKKMMTTLTRMPSGKHVIVSKGAIDVLINICSYVKHGKQTVPLTSSRKKMIEKINQQMASNGLRILAVAYLCEYPSSKLSKANFYTEGGMTLLGLIGMMDPPRDGVKESIAECTNAGIRTVMITGDHPLTAKAIARQLGITPSDCVTTGKELESMDDNALRKKINNCSIFARVSPEHKVRIVKAFQQNGLTTAMTGDGVNDAPALKIADIGCSMGKNGTDVARNASDIILTDDNFSTIVSAVREGRRIYSNIKKSICFLLSSNIGEILTISAAILMRMPSPLTAVQLLWINLVTDSLPAISLGMEPEENDVMNKPPVKDPSKIFTKSVIGSIVTQGLMIGTLALVAFMAGYRILPDSHNLCQGRTMAFAVLGLSQLFHSFNMKSSQSLQKSGITNNRQLLISFIICFILQITVMIIPGTMNLFGVVPLGITQWIIVILLSFLPIPLVELQKKINNLNE